jgi:endoglucanase
VGERDARPRLQEVRARTDPTCALRQGCTSGFTVSWTASTDNRAVTGYDVFLNGASAGTTTTTSRAFTGLTCGTSYTVAVDAYDAAGNHSAQASLTTKTAACSTPPPPPPPPPASGLHLSGNQLLDARNKLVRLHGVNYSGPEYACIQGWGVFDGPSDDASVTAIRSWNSNVVHIGLNEDCILGINGAPAAYSGSNYMNAIVAYVNKVHSHGMYAEVSLMWPRREPRRRSTTP